EIPAELSSAEAPPAPQAEEIDLEEILSAAPAPKTPAPPRPPVAPEPEPEFELEQDYDLVIQPEPLVPAHDQRPPEAPIQAMAQPEPVAQNAASPANGAFASDQFLADLANEIDQLGIGELTPSASEPVHSAHPPALEKPEPHPASAGHSGPLKEVFD